MRRLALCLIALLVFPAAHAKKTAVWVQAETNPDRPEAIPSGAKISIFVDPEAGSSVLHAEIAAKIAQSLHERGYVLASPDEAELCVLFGFGTKSEKLDHTVTTRSPARSQGSSFSSAHVRGGGGYTHHLSPTITERGQMKTAQSHGSRVSTVGARSSTATSTTRNSTVSYHHGFVATVIDAKEFHRDEEVRIMWKGEARLAATRKSPGSESDERVLQLLDLLRMAAFENFGRTQELIKKKYDLDSPVSVE